MYYQIKYNISKIITRKMKTILTILIYLRRQSLKNKSYLNYTFSNDAGSINCNFYCKL